MIQIIHINLQLTPKKPLGLDTWEPGFSSTLNRFSKLSSSFDIRPAQGYDQSLEGLPWRPINEVATICPHCETPITKPAIAE